VNAELEWEPLAALVALCAREIKGTRPAGRILDRAEGHGIVVEYVEPLWTPCSYPSHRYSDWEAELGRKTCGLCHPRAIEEPVDVSGYQVGKRQ
jgi:hypothetical protein